MNRDPMTSRHPFEIFLLALSIVSGLPVLVGAAPVPVSIAKAGATWLQYVWCGALVAGPAIALVGIWWPAPRDRAKLSVTGISLEQVGLVTVAGAAVFYAVALLLVAGSVSLVASGIIAAYGASCGWRSWQLQKVLRGPRVRRPVLEEEP